MREYDSQTKKDFDDLYSFARLLISERQRGDQVILKKKYKQGSPPLSLSSLFEVIREIDEVLKELSFKLQRELNRRGYLGESYQHYSELRRLMDLKKRYEKLVKGD